MGKEGKGTFWDGVTAGIFCILGKGKVDYPALLRAMKASGFSGYATIEQDFDNKIDDEEKKLMYPATCSMQSVKYLRDLDSPPAGALRIHRRIHCFINVPCRGNQVICLHFSDFRFNFELFVRRATWFAANFVEQSSLRVNHKKWIAASFPCQTWRTQIWSACVGTSSSFLDAASRVLCQK